MKFARVQSAHVSLLKPYIVDIETDITRGLHTFSIVGLPDKGIDEARDRVSAAIKHSGFKSPKQKNEKVIISLAPAHIKKEGSGFDVGIALSYLLATEEIEFNPKGKIFVGELALDGSVRPIRGMLPLAEYAKSKDIEEIYVPFENAAEAALIEGIDIYAIKNFKELLKHLNTKEIEGWESKKIESLEPTEITLKDVSVSIDMGDIKGQEIAKRALEIAAAGGHNICMFGPPGTGKTMLAKAFAGILPNLSRDEMLKVTGIHSISGTLDHHLITNPPFRSPHHTASYVSIVGGGSNPRPGEVTLAHKGVLFLDEFPEFDRKVIESLRQPLEDHVVTVARARGTVEFPAHFILIAAMNPCPCGYRGSKTKECKCSARDLLKYERKISGPIIDRVDMWVEVDEIPHKKLLDDSENENTSEKTRKSIEKTRKIQHERYGKQITNSELSSKQIQNYIKLSASVRELLELSAKKLELSPRAFHRVMKLSRTIADLEESKEIDEKHILEALQYRPRLS